ncbi:YbjN domain-containing protein [Cupriavidus sp. WS]|uniref:YbjN domain-containing protein n=1 Tax=Cupriavidus sp. WS TaxID=1312922 RepID=UPI00037914E8|nr:YbjN domain-containing protein [Cupriavidus sp. WS]
MNVNDETKILSAIDADTLAGIIRAAGCAVTMSERDGRMHLHSASHGVGFQVLWGNPAEAGGYADFTLSCALRVAGGEVPRALLDGWHRGKRFARVATHGELIVLEMDVVLHGGVTQANLAAMLRLWVVMTGEYLLHLRNAVPEAGGAPAGAGTTDPAAVS